MFRSFQSIKKPIVADNLPKCNYYSASIFDEFLVDEEGTRNSDITFLFNQQRLDKYLSKDNFDDYFRKLLQDGAPNPYEGMSDDQIIGFVKDRRMSSFNDWYNYTKNLTYDARELNEWKEQLHQREAKQKAERERIDAALASLQ